MEQHYNPVSHNIDLQLLHDHCRQHGEAVTYARGECLEREGEQAQWFAFVEQGCFKYTTNGISDGREHITWFSFADEFVGDYPNVLYGRPAQMTIEAIIPSRVWQISGEHLHQFFSQSPETMMLHTLVSDHILTQFQARYIDFFRATPRERYDMLLQRCPGIVNDLPLKTIASFLNITPKTLSMLRRTASDEQK